ncbi:cytochrome c1 [Methyloligella sp. 2.7D]|uniref:cytochrome c1 n=1 Tax=unclassified Methyloligella TaxID=2625955 RepID=UPI00157D9FA1|nr:cytochrome c1 [Methyloligella sp. GL2]QKP77016.1 cytochrome c1 [Methyloligella sp. GL2]
MSFSMTRMRAAGLAAALGLAAVLAVPAQAAEHGPELKELDWSFSGPFGMYDRAQLQRGYQVYKTICANCHSMNLMSYRNLGEPGGPEFSEGDVKTLASQAQVTDGPNDQGDMFKRPGRPSDRFVAPFANPQMARAANGGALPPDLSVMAKAREGGPDYIYSLLTGYGEKPDDMQMAPGMHYNEAFPGHQIAMLPPLADGVVPYTDDTPKTLDNYAKDVAAFLMWTAEPKLEERHKLGTRVMVFLFVFAIIMYLAKKAVWKGKHHKAI